MRRIERKILGMVLDPRETGNAWKKRSKELGMSRGWKGNRLIKRSSIPRDARLPKSEWIRFEHRTHGQGNVVKNYM